MAHEHCNSEWSIDDVMADMLKEIQIFEINQQYTGKPISLDTTMPTTGSFHASTCRTLQSYTHAAPQRKELVCVFCKGNHKPTTCTKVVDSKERLAFVRRDKTVWKNTR